jgi:hypothetical protein
LTFTPTALDLVGIAIQARSRRQLWRAILVLLGVRRLTPTPGSLLPSMTTWIDGPGDTGGGWRADHRMQDPAVDPREPGSGDSSSEGNDHGWSNCTASSGADVFAYQTGKDSLWGGDLRHDQADRAGGIDLYDLRDAWAANGQTLTIRSGAGWSAVETAHNEGRAIVIQGTGNVPGAGTFTGGHACAIAPESQSDGDWLFGDPLVSDWQWIPKSAIKSWAQAWQSSIAFAVSKIPATAPPDPAPSPKPPAPPPPPSWSEAEVRTLVALGFRYGVLVAGDVFVQAWVDWLSAPPVSAPDHWDAGSWGDEYGLGTLLVLLREDCPDPGTPAAWGRGPILAPVADAAAALASDPVWDGIAWRAGVWSA